MYSVVIANFNYGHYLKQAIESALLVSDDVIVVDDYSTDNSNQVIAECLASDYRSKLKAYKFPHNQGVSAARNFGIYMAKHPYIICLDADDTLNPAIKDVKQDADIIGIGWTHFEGRDNTVIPPDGLSLESFKEYNQIPVSSPFSKKIWQKVGGFKTMLGYEDWHFWVECLKAGATIRTERQSLLNYRIHPKGRNIEAIKNHNELKKQII